jgi:hypothetical protein
MACRNLPFAGQSDTRVWLLQGSDSDETKFFGAVINALIFVVTVTLMTFGLYLLFKYRVSQLYDRFYIIVKEVFFGYGDDNVRNHRALCSSWLLFEAVRMWMQCTNVIKGYFAFAGFSIYFTLFGLITLQILQALEVTLDIITFTFLLWNFAVRPYARPQLPRPYVHKWRELLWLSTNMDDCCKVHGVPKQPHVLRRPDRPLPALSYLNSCQAWVSVAASCGCVPD